MKLDIDSVLNKLMNHKVTISFTPHEEAELRQTSGTLKEISRDIIHLETYDVYGKLDHYYLNRHACTLHSIVDEGEQE